jgi:hypothetical protein
MIKRQEDNIKKLDCTDRRQQMELAQVMLDADSSISGVKPSCSIPQN